MDAETAVRWGIPLVEVSSPLVANSLNGQNIGRIMKVTTPLKLRISGNHQEKISLLIIDTPHSPVILGHPWMVKHNPEIDWGKHKILGWGTSCSTRCLHKAHSPAAVPQQGVVLNLEKVLVEYHDLKEVFCKSRVTCLSPHRPYDCTIDLKPGTLPPKGRLFSLSRPEIEAMEKYLGESLAAGIIRPSSSPACRKKGRISGALIIPDYLGINKITVKN